MLSAADDYDTEQGECLASRPRAAVLSRPQATLGNEHVLNISQDLGGVQGWRLRGELDAAQVWVRPLAGTAKASKAPGQQSIAERLSAQLSGCCRSSTAKAAHVAVALFNGGTVAGWLAHVVLLPARAVSYDL